MSMFVRIGGAPLMCMIALYDTHSPLAMVRALELFPRRPALKAPAIRAADAAQRRPARRRRPGVAAWPRSRRGRRRWGPAERPASPCPPSPHPAPPPPPKNPPGPGPGGMPRLGRDGGARRAGKHHGIELVLGHVGI